MGAAQWPPSGRMFLLTRGKENIPDNFVDVGNLPIQDDEFYHRDSWLLSFFFRQGNIELG